MIMLNEKFWSPSKKDTLQQRLNRVKEEKIACGQKLEELDKQGKEDEMGDWMHTLMGLEKEEEELVRALEDL